ncbi:MAG: regulatory signaling modulator protein AmpE [Nevskiales bacterium]
MTLIGIILALIAERLLSQLREWREHAWYARYLDWLDQRSKLPWLWHSAWGLLLLIAAPVAAVALIQALLHGGVITLLGLLFGVLVLVFCLGPRDLAEEIHSYLDAQAAGDHGESERIAADLSRLPPGAVSTGSEECRGVVRGVLIQGHERLLAVLFWFYLLGPMGAVLYRLSATLPGLLQQRDVSDNLREVALRLHAILAWLPVRLSAALYTLAGSTDDALQAWRAQTGDEGDWSAQSWRLLARVGCGAMQMEDSADQPVKLEPEDALIEALALVRRALLLGLGVLAAFTIGGWLT